MGDINVQSYVGVSVSVYVRVTQKSILLLYLCCGNCTDAHCAVLVVLCRQINMKYIEPI